MTHTSWSSLALLFVYSSAATESLQVKRSHLVFNLQVLALGPSFVRGRQEDVHELSVVLLNAFVEQEEETVAPVRVLQYDMCFWVCLVYSSHTRCCHRRTQQQSEILCALQCSSMTTIGLPWCVFRDSMHSKRKRPHGNAARCFPWLAAPYGWQHFQKNNWIQSFAHVFPVAYDCIGAFALLRPVFFRIDLTRSFRVPFRLISEATNSLWCWTYDQPSEAEHMLDLSSIVFWEEGIHVCLCTYSFSCTVLYRVNFSRYQRKFVKTNCCSGKITAFCSIPLFTCYYLLATVLDTMAVKICKPTCLPVKPAAGTSRMCVLLVIAYIVSIDFRFCSCCTTQYYMIIGLTWCQASWKLTFSVELYCCWFGLFAGRAQHPQGCLPRTHTKHDHMPVVWNYDQQHWTLSWYLIGAVQSGWDIDEQCDSCNELVHSTWDTGRWKCIHVRALQHPCWSNKKSEQRGSILAAPIW